MGINPSNRRGHVVNGVDVRRTAPVEEVEWVDADAFLEKLPELVKTKTDAPGFGLPTEAEWEYACRAGTTTRFWSGDDESDLEWVGWFRGNSRSTTVWPMGDCTTHPVAELAANAFGLFDVHGNVWEWCEDWYEEGYYAKSPRVDPLCENDESDSRVIRGGFAWAGGEFCRAAARSSNTPDCSHNDIGFRVAANRL
jgi:formylglycine-generating enzyme required for sulfatase activity